MDMLRDMLDDGQVPEISSDAATEDEDDVMWDQKGSW